MHCHSLCWWVKICKYICSSFFLFWGGGDHERVQHTIYTEKETSTVIFFKRSSCKHFLSTSIWPINIFLQDQSIIKSKRGKKQPSEVLHEAALCNLVAMTMRQRATLAISVGKPLFPALHWNLEPPHTYKISFSLDRSLLYPHSESLEMTVSLNID